MQVTQPFSINAGGTVASGNTLAVTTADKLTEGGVIIPQTLFVTIDVDALGVSETVFIADAAYQVTGVNAVWGTASVSGTLTIEKLTGTTAPNSGTVMLTGTIDLSTTANTVTAGALTGTVSTLQLATGNRIGIKLSGTLTSLVGCNVTISLKRI